MGINKTDLAIFHLWNIVRSVYITLVSHIRGEAYSSF